MSKQFYQKPFFIILVTIIFYIITASVFFLVNALINDGNNVKYSKEWNLKYSLIQAIIPTLILLGFIFFGGKFKKRK